MTTMERMDEKSSTVTFDVGGTIHRVSRTTLMRFPDTMLYVSASERWNKEDCTTDAIYIDRNGERFQYILDYMRDNEVNLPSCLSKDAILNEFKFYGFSVDTNSIKIHSVHSSDLLEHVRCWKKQRLDKIIELDKEEIELNRKSIEINRLLKDNDLEKKYTEFCFELFQSHLAKGQVRWYFLSNRFDQFGGFYTHTNAEEYNSSDGPHPIYLDNKLLQKCAESFQISYITAYTCFSDKGIRRYDVKIEMKDQTTIEAEKQKTE